MGGEHVTHLYLITELAHCHQGKDRSLRVKALCRFVKLSNVHIYNLHDSREFVK